MSAFAATRSARRVRVGTRAPLGDLESLLGSLDDVIPDDADDIALLLEDVIATTKYEVRHEPANRPTSLAWSLSQVIELPDR